MKTFRLFAALSILALLAACGQTPTAPTETTPPAPNPYLEELNSAEAGWQQLKNEYGSSYRYVTRGGAVWGPAYETTLTIENEKVVQRDLSLIEIDENTGETTVTEIWSETGEAIGSHPDSGASAPVTVETYFESCKKAVDVPKINTYEVYLQYISPENVTPVRETVLASCNVIPPGMVQDGGGSMIRLEFLPEAP